MLLSREVQSLLSKLCIDLGFCLPPDAQAHLEQSPPSQIGEFTDAVFTAEGLDPTTADRHLYRQVKAVVAAAFRRSEEERLRDT
jgi:hypothetical protein